jgi:hypothetical protein
MRDKFVNTLEALHRYLEASASSSPGEIAAVAFAALIVEKLPKELFDSLFEEFKQNGKILGINC